MSAVCVSLSYVLVLVRAVSLPYVEPLGVFVADPLGYVLEPVFVPVIVPVLISSMSVAVFVLPAVVYETLTRSPTWTSLSRLLSFPDRIIVWGSDMTITFEPVAVSTTTRLAAE